MVYTIDEIKKLVAPVAEKYNLEKVYLFGSYARGEATENSDVDLKIDGDGDIRSLFELSGLFLELQEALKKSIDLVTASALRQDMDDPLTQKFAAEIQREEKLIYARPALKQG